MSQAVSSRRRRTALRAADTALALILAGTAVVQSWDVAGTEGVAGSQAVHVALAAASTAPLLVRHRSPVLSLLVITAAAWLQYELGAGLGQPFFAALLALYTVGVKLGWPRTASGPAVVIAMALGIDLPRLLDGAALDEVVPAWFVMTGAWALGRWVRARQRDTAALAERASRAEQEREESARQAVADERARIARELHDLVAHSMGIIVLQAQGGQRVLEQEPDAARRALENIEVTARHGLGEMRRLLGLLTGAGTSDTHPQPSLDRLEELAEQVRQAGLDVELRVEGSLVSLAPGVQLAAYRIVQEALTNALKHAGPTARAAVTVRRCGNDVEVEVVDSGSRGTAPGNGSGRGLVGMQERVALYDGELEVGPGPDGGFRVAARLTAPVGAA